MFFGHAGLRGGENTFLLAITFCSDIKQISGASSAKEMQHFAWSTYSPLYFPTLGWFFKMHSKVSKVWGVKDATWTSRGSGIWLLVKEHLSCVIHFPAIIQSITSPNRPWSHQNWKWHCDELLHRGVDICVHVCGEMDWRALRRAGCTLPVAALLSLFLSNTQKHTHTHCLAVGQN